MSGFADLGPYSRDCLEAFDLLEINEATVKAIHDAPHSRFTPLGSVMLIGEPVAAGIKKRDVFRAGHRVAKELYLADHLLTKFPKRSNALPIFTFPVRTEREYVGILTEDWTRNDTLALIETRNRLGLDAERGRHQAPEGLQRDVYDALNGRVDTEAFRHMMGVVCAREVLVDFDDVAYPSTTELAPYNELVDAITVVIA